MKRTLQTKRRTEDLSIFILLFSLMMGLSLSVNANNSEGIIRIYNIQASNPQVQLVLNSSDNGAFVVSCDALGNPTVKPSRTIIAISLDEAVPLKSTSIMCPPTRCGTVATAKK